MKQTRRVNREAQLLRVEISSFERLCEGNPSPRAITCFMLARAGEWAQYLNLDRPDFESPTFTHDYLVTECMKKNPRISHPDLDPESAARNSWYEAESWCRQTNRDIVKYVDGSHDTKIGAFRAEISSARRFISRVLGSVTYNSLCYVHEHMRFGPGSTSAVNGLDVSPANKFTASPQCTEVLYPFADTIIGDGAWSKQVERPFPCVKGNKVTFVPKTAKTHRPIAVEPHLNIFVQLGVGALIRQRLKRIGLDLTVQKTKNRSYASRAQRDGLCTIDLTSASDTLSYRLVELLMPADWFQLLNLARCSYSEIDGRWFPLSKFSSMGNGYTFELETLIFLALAYAAGSLDPQVFGDDIICEQNVGPRLVSLLEGCGFRTNTKKTFLTGRFFESCGEDYLDGENVRPFYFKRKKGSYVSTDHVVISYANNVSWYAHRRCGYFGRCRSYRSAYTSLLRDHVRARQTYGTLNGTAIPSDALIKDFDDCSPAVGGFGYRGRSLKLVTSRKRFDEHPGAIIHALSSTRGDGAITFNRLATRGSKMVESFGTAYYNEWYLLGPWM